MENSLNSFYEVINLAEIPDDVDMLICSICSNILWNQVCCKSCKKFYCSMCVSYYVHTQKTCPCGQKFRTTPHNILMDKQLEKLVFRCPNTSCGKLVKYLDTQKHQAECLYQEQPDSIINKTFSMASEKNKKDHRKSVREYYDIPLLTQGAKSNSVVSSFLNYQRSVKNVYEAKKGNPIIATEFKQDIGNLIHKYVGADSSQIDKLVTEPCSSQFSADAFNEDNKNDCSRKSLSSSSKASIMEAKENIETAHTFSAESNEQTPMNYEQIAQKLASFSIIKTGNDLVKVRVPQQILAEIMGALEKCSLCEKIILKTCIKGCKECNGLTCLICQTNCKVCHSVFCLKCTGLSGETVSQCSKCEMDICKNCRSFCSECTKTVCNDCKYTCSRCTSIFCTKCEAKKIYCSCCKKALCKPCSTFCEGCKTYVCIDTCLKRCKGCEQSFCTNCAKECKNCYWALTAEGNPEKIVELSSSNTVAKALDPCSEDCFVITGNKEFKKGIHEFEVLLNQVQRDCAGYGIGICATKDFEIWKANSNQNKDASKILLGLTANNYGISPALIGPRHFLKPGQTYNITINCIEHILQITGPETKVVANLSPEEGYLPLFTRCHGKFQITVHPVNYIDNV